MLRNGGAFILAALLHASMYIQVLQGVFYNDTRLVVYKIKDSETKILYLANVNVMEPKEVQNIEFVSHYPFPKICSPLFYTTYASNSYIPPTALEVKGNCSYCSACAVGDNHSCNKCNLNYPICIAPSFYTPCITSVH